MPYKGKGSNYIFCQNWVMSSIWLSNIFLRIHFHAKVWNHLLQWCFSSFNKDWNQDWFRHLIHYWHWIEECSWQCCMTAENTVVSIFPLNDRLSVVFQSSIALIYFGKPFFSLSPLCGGTDWVETVIHGQQILCEPITILPPLGDPSNSVVKVQE